MEFNALQMTQADINLGSVSKVLSVTKTPPGGPTSTEHKPWVETLQRNAAINIGEPAVRFLPIQEWYEFRCTETNANAGIPFI